jgi:hypothetical protein
MPTKRITTSLRLQVAARAHGNCEYCRSQEMYATEPFSVDHIIPRVRGGKTQPDNLAYACLGCNSYKSTQTDALDKATGEPAPLFNPRTQKWGDHFTWNEDLTEVIGITPTGRATIQALKLNRGNVVNLRRLLLLVGEHPPQ